MLDINPLYAPPNTDSGVFLYVGSQILKGKLPYRDVWDHKGPLIYYLDALGLWMGHGSVWGVWLLEFMLLTFAFIVIFEVVYSFGGMLAAFVGCVAGYYFLNMLVQGNLTEEYNFIFTCLAVFIYICKAKDKEIWYVVIGFVSACGFLLRPNNIGVPVAIMLSMLIVEIHEVEVALIKRRFLLFLAGFAFVTLVVIIYWGANSGLPDLIDQVFVFNFAYSRFHRSVGIAVWPENPLFSWVMVGGYLIIILAALFKWFPDKNEKRIVTLLIVWIPIEIALTSISGRGFQHYFINWIPCLILLTGFIQRLLISRALMRKDETLDLVFFFELALCFLVLNFNFISQYLNIANTLIFRRANGVEKIPLVDRYVRENTRIEDKVLVWGHGGSINFMSQRDAPTKYLYQTAALFTPGYTTQQMVEGFLSDLRKDPPELVIVFENDQTSPFLPVISSTYGDYLYPMKGDFSEFFQANYHMEAHLQSVSREVYRLNSFSLNSFSSSSDMITR